MSRFLDENPFPFFHISRTRFLLEEEDSTHEHRSAKKDRLVRSWNRILRSIDKTSDVNPFDGIFTSISLSFFLSSTIVDTREMLVHRCHLGIGPIRGGREEVWIRRNLWRASPDDGGPTLFPSTLDKRNPRCLVTLALSYWMIGLVFRYICEFHSWGSATTRVTVSAMARHVNTDSLLHDKLCG